VTGGYAEPGWTMRDVAAARRPFDCRCTQVLQRRERERLPDALVTRVTGLLDGTRCHHLGLAGRAEPWVSRRWRALRASADAALSTRGVAFAVGISFRARCSGQRIRF